jgi:hypothetical protein
VISSIVFADGLASAMAGARLDAQQVGSNTEVGGRDDEDGPASR